MTAFLARESCIDPGLADVIANYTEAPDQDIARSPVLNGGLGWAGMKKEQSILREWHSPKPEVNGGEVVPGSPYARQKVEAGLPTGNLKTFGEAMHPFEDRFGLKAGRIYCSWR